MDTIKKILHPGKAEDDEKIYGSGGQQTKHTGGLGGEGSHFGSERDRTTGTGLDPRVDSDRDGSKTTGSGSGTAGGYTKAGSGLTRTGPSSSNTAGPHSSDLANKADPRVDSDRSKTVGSGNTESNPGYTGTSQGSSYHAGPTGTAVSGPHSTDTANHLDPSVSTRGTGTEDAQHHSTRHGGGSEEVDSHHGVGTGAALGVGATGAGLAAHQHNKHENERDTGLRTSTGRSTTSKSSSGLGDSSTSHGTSTGQDDYQIPGAFPGPAPNTAGPHKSDILNKLDPGVDATPNTTSGKNSGATSSNVHDSANTNDHHTGKDAALVGGGAAAAGTGTDVYNNVTSRDPSHQQSDSIVDRRREAYTPATGTHSSDTTTHNHSTSRDNALGGVPGAGSGAGVYNSVTSREPVQQSDSILDRSRGDYAGTSATSGPHSSNIANRADLTVDTDRSKEFYHGRDAALVGGAAGYGASRHHDSHDTTTGSGTTTSGPHCSDLANRADQRVDIDRSKENDTHHGRDAALVGGAGTAGYGASKHHDSHDTTTGSGNATAGPYSSDLANHADPRVDSDRSNEKETHHGRDATLVGGAGAAAYGADKHHDSKDQKQLEKEHKQELKEEKKAQKEAEKEQKHADKEHEKEHKKEHKGLFSFLHRDKSKKYTQEEESEFDRQEREHNSSSHTGRDAALAGTAVGGATAAHKSTYPTDADTNKGLPTAPGNHGVGTGEGTHNALSGDQSTGTHSTTTGSHGDSRPVGSTPLAEKPRGTDLGDKLHDVERNRGVQSGNTAGEGDFDTDRDGRPIGSTSDRQHDNLTSGTTGPSGLGSGTSHHQSYHDSSARKDADFVGQYNTIDTREGQQSGALGSSGVGNENVYGKSDTTSGAYSGKDYGLTGNTGSSESTGRNKLHKDPPAGHHAAQSQSQTGTELDGNTGVSNSHEGNLTRNY